MLSTRLVLFVTPQAGLSALPRHLGHRQPLEAPISVLGRKRDLNLNGAVALAESAQGLGDKAALPNSTYHLIGSDSSCIVAFSLKPWRTFDTLNCSI